MRTLYTRLAPLGISTLLLSMSLLCGCSQEEQKPSSSSLVGLTAVDVSEIGPWVIDEDRQLEGIPGLSAELRQTAIDRLTARHLTIANQNGDKIKNPKLKLYLDFGDKHSLAPRGRHMQSMKLVLEDEVFLERNPPLKMHITSWSADRAQQPGVTKANQIKGTFSLLLDQFINNYRQEQARTTPRPDEHSSKTRLAGNT